MGETKMKILLTGNKGYIGSRLEQSLSMLGHTIVGLDIKHNEIEDLLFCQFPEDEFDLVIHLAGRSGVRESIKDPTAYWMNNVEASRRLFERYADTRVLYASSSSAYEPDLNPYAASKYVMEELAERYPDTLGMRFHTVYSDTPRKGMFFDKMLTGKLEYITSHYRDFIHMNDLIEAIKILMINTHVNGVIDIGSGVPIKVQDLAPELPVRLNTPGERNFTCANIEKLTSLGWRPKYTVENFLTKPEKGNIINLFNGETI